MHEPTDRFTLHNRINLPVCDIHEKQARSQLLANMHSFANATSTISERQMQKCQEQNERIKMLGQRISKCKNRIGHISTLKTAVTFVTPSQYPKYQLNIQSSKSRLSAFYQHEKINRYDPSSDFKTKHDVQSFGKESKISLKNMHECASFILDELRMQPKGALQKGNKANETVQNYGSIPSTVKYLDSLSVFNARVNPYRKYSIQSNVLKIDKRSKLSKENLAPIMGDYLSQFGRVRNVEKTHRYVQPQSWMDHQFDLSLDLQNVVEFEGDEVKDSIEKKAQKVVQEERKIENKSKNGKHSEDVKEEKVPLLNTEKHATILIEEKIVKKEKDLLFVPEIQPSLLPIPPQSDLPIPPINPTIPSFNLPPPPPKLDLPPPQLSPPPIFDLPNLQPLSSPNQNALQVPAASGNLLQEIKNARNKLKLKPIITKEPGVKSNLQNEGPKQPDKGSGQSDMFEEMRAVLKRRKQRRYQALHPDQFADQ